MSYPLFLFRIQSLILKKPNEKAYSDSTFRFNGKEWEGQALRNRPVAYFCEGARPPRGRGNFYYGARYYDPKISVWLSVDPLAKDFPGWSPYDFNLNSPLNLVDPDGMAPGDPTKGRKNRQKPEILGFNFTLNLNYGQGGVETRLLGTRSGLLAHVGKSNIIEFGASQKYDPFSFRSPVLDRVLGVTNDKTKSNGFYAGGLLFGYGIQDFENIDTEFDKVNSFYTNESINAFLYTMRSFEGKDKFGNEYFERYEGLDLGISAGIFVLGFDINLSYYWEPTYYDYPPIIPENLRIFPQDNTEFKFHLYPLE